MIVAFENVDPESAADDISKDYIEVTVEEALQDLRTPGAGEFFGRIDEDADRWYMDGVISKMHSTIRLSLIGEPRLPPRSTEPRISPRSG